MLYRSSNWDFWQTAIAVRGSALPRVGVWTLLFGAFALLVYVVNEATPKHHLGIGAAPFEIGGGVLGALVVLRTNAGYDRWWEARKLWGSIVNQSRTLVITALANGPDESLWRNRIVRLAAAFPHVIRHRLRSERSMPEVAHLLGNLEAARIAGAEHMPSYVALLISQTLREGRDRFKLDPFVFLQLDKDLNALMDYVGGCERILKTPLSRVYAIEIHRLILGFLLSVPFVLIDKLDYHWTNPLVTMLIAYPLLAINQIGIDLQNPFDIRRLGHLELDSICETIEHNVMTLLSNNGQPQMGEDDLAQSQAVPIL